MSVSYRKGTVAKLKRDLATIDRVRRGDYIEFVTDMIKENV